MKRIKVLNFRLWLQVCGLVFLAFAACGCGDSLLKSSGSVDTGGDAALIARAAEIIRAALAGSNPRIRANAVEVVADARVIYLMPKVQRLLRDDFVPVRFAAVLAVGDLKYSLADESVRRLLEDPDENVRIAAAYAMGKLGYPNSFEFVKDAIVSKDQVVRANAAMLLGKSGDKSALKLLYRAMKDEYSEDKVSFQAAEAIARLGDERIYPKLWAMLISAYADDRVLGIRSMGALATTEARNALITMLSDDILEVRLAAAEQLGLLKDNTGEPEVLDVFAKNLTAEMDKEGRERVNGLTALAIGRLGTPALVKFLPQLLENESKFVRIAAAKAVFQCAMYRRSAEKSPN